MVNPYHHKNLAIPAIVALLTLLLVAGCGGGDAPNETATVTDTLSRTDYSTDTGSSTSTVGDSSTTAAGRVPTIASIQADVSDMRGLPVLAAIDIAYIDREQLRLEMEEELADEYPADELAVEERVLKSLDLLDEDMDLLSTLEDMLSAGILGFYDDETGELKVVSETEVISPLNEITLAHEITHALQDQNFSLDVLLPPDGSGNDDRDLAVLSLIEGDATVTDEEYMAMKLDLSDMIGVLGAALGAPMGLGSSYLENTLSFPYLEGGRFVKYIRSRGGWTAVDGVYRKPPESTEQILHPEKYLSGESPVMVTIHDLSSVTGVGWNITYENILGEFDVQQILTTSLPMSRSMRAAAGWGGGSIAYYENSDGEALLVYVLVWDSVDEADEFSLAMGEHLEQHTGGGFVFQEGRPPYIESGNESWALAQRQAVSVVVMAPDTDLATRVAAQVIDR